MSFDKFFLELQQCLCKKCGAPRNELKKEETSSDLQDAITELEADEELKVVGKVKIYYCKKCDETSISSPVRMFGFDE